MKVRKVEVSDYGEISKLTEEYLKQFKRVNPKRKAAN